MSTGHIVYCYSPKSTVFSDCLSISRTSQDLVQDDPARVLSTATASQTWPALRETGQVSCSRPSSTTGLSVLASDLGSVIWRKTTRYGSLLLLFHCLGEKPAPLQKRASPASVHSMSLSLLSPPVHVGRICLWIWGIYSLCCALRSFVPLWFGACHYFRKVPSGCCVKFSSLPALPCLPGVPGAHRLRCWTVLWPPALWVSRPPFSMTSARLSSWALPSPWPTTAEPVFIPVAADS